jgi:hypothetical protein
MYWPCQRFAGKGLVVVREGIRTPNTLSHHHGGARRRGDPRLISGSLFFV